MGEAVKRGACTVIPAALHAWRTARGLTQAELAAAAELSEAIIGHAERGIRNLSTRSVKAIADALGVAPEAIAVSNDKDAA